MSIRHHLLIALLSALLLVGIGASTATYYTTHEEASRLFDYQLRQMALSLRDQNMQGYSRQRGDYDFIVQVWDLKGSRTYVSDRNIALPAGRPGFDTVSLHGADWRIYTFADGIKTIQVAQLMSLRQDQAGELALRILIPIVLSIPLFALLIWWILGRSLRPLRDMAQAVGKREPESLTPLPDHDLPAELQPMATELNGLLARLAAAIAAQQQFTADAAHELRTPLTALQLQLQLVERAQSADDRQEALEHLKAGARRAARLVDQLLTLARFEPNAGQEPMAPLQLDALALASVAELEAIAEAKPVELRLGRIEAAPVSARAEALRILLNNLIQNAIRYTPSGGRITVDAYAEAGEAVLAVTDTGPGIPLEERARVFDRFYRVPGRGETGSGLGLAIVKSIAGAHTARIEMGGGEGGIGLRVRVRFAAREHGRS
ncbi:MAG: HAMP domain-containing protein [Betaproteobacteria bacterium]|nr:HAMP domain-containing protein [Betaproteobacteria bacterium]